MRIVHIITRMIVGGAQENTLYNCLDLLNDYGDDVTLVTGPSLGAEGQLLNPDRIGRLKVIELRSLQRSIHPIVDRRAYREIYELLARIEPDVVHTHSAKAGMLGRAAAWSLNIPCVVHTVHGAPFHPYQNGLSRWVFQQCERWAAKRCHKMICVADAMTQLMVDARVAPLEKFQTIYSGMEVQPFIDANSHRQKMRLQLGFHDNHVVFGKIARLYNLKGHEYLIDAAERVSAANPNVRFLLVGDGILREALEAEIAKRGLTDRFVFTGLVPPEDIPKYLGAMDALVHTSLREGLARALPQALIAGKPVISFDVDGAREVVLNDQTGFLIKPKSIDELERAISSLAADESLRTRLGATGREKFTQQFRHETMSQQIRSVYVNILGKCS